MKKIFFILMVLILLASPLLAADWTYTIKSVVQNSDTLQVSVDYSDGEKTYTEEVPIFRPNTKEDVLIGVRNRANDVKIRPLLEAAKQAAAKKITDVVKPDVDKDINKPTPTLTAVEG